MEGENFFVSVVWGVVISMGVGRAAVQMLLLIMCLCTVS